MHYGSRLRDSSLKNEKYIEVLWSECKSMSLNQYDEDEIDVYLEEWEEEEEEDEEYNPVNPFESSYGFLGSNVRRNTITKIIFTDDISLVPEHAWDASETQDQSVMAWTENISEEGWPEVVIAGKGGVCVDDSSVCLFTQCTRLKEIRFNGAFDTSQMTSMYGMFKDCNELVELDISGWNTGNVTKMTNMFEGCQKLEKVNLTGIDVGQVTDMYHMFGKCKSLKQISFKGLDTSRVTTMSGLFSECTNLVSADMAGLDTSNVTDMSGMFWGCSNLEHVDLTGWDTGKVTKYNTMFYNCQKLKELDVTHFDTRNATYMGWMFWGCKNLKEIDVSHFDTSALKHMASMFGYCFGLKEIDLSNFHTSKVRSMERLFEECKNLEKVDLSSFDTSNVDDMRCMFYKCESLKELDIRNFDMRKVSDHRQMIKGDNSMFYGVKCPIKQTYPYQCLEGKRIPFGSYPQPGERKRPLYWIVSEVTYYTFSIRLENKIVATHWDRNVQDEIGKWEDEAIESWLLDEFAPKAFSLEEKKCADVSWDSGLFLPDFIDTAKCGCYPYDVPEIRLAMRLSKRKIDELLPGFLDLAYWLTWELDEFAFPSLTGMAKNLYREEEVKLARFIEDLEKAAPEQREKFYVPIYEVLGLMAAQDDAESIKRVFELCSNIELDGYYDGVTPLGYAVENNALRAIDSLITGGMKGEWCSFGMNEDALEFAISREASEETILQLVKYGAYVNFNMLYSLVVEEENISLARKILQNADAENIQDGRGIQGLEEENQMFFEATYNLSDTKEKDWKEFAEFLKDTIIRN